MKVLSKQEQFNSPLFGGRLYENRPISFPQGSHTDAYSNLFYWANVEAIQDGEFGLHPHQGFEIMTFIFKGALEHFDTKTQKWTPLKAGGVQVIQSGNGVQHAEKYKQGSQAFQIWFDPNFAVALKKSAGYKDYQKDAFEFVKENGIQTKHYVGNGGPIVYDSPEIAVKMLLMDKGANHIIEANKKRIYSMYLLSGAVTINDKSIQKDDYIILEDTDKMELSVAENSELFIVETPQALSYKSQADFINGRK